ncbi:hypothetical protein OG735_14545 [Streptomyces sp. NBC_01210]|uniref:hypothetical protein n=1 Tax=Streptomyces sp. NBC_01210 TaxID=2903774 RepID=UPI002E15E33D|nr:hypothetical protein OG735_14545 [Streptomyces sp. NBC_01210]
MSDMEFEKSPQTYGSHQAPAHYQPGPGCLTTVIRIPVRIVVLLVVLPVRMVWDVLVVCALAADRILLRPLRRALTWVYENVLTPIGHGLAWLAAFIGKALFVWPWVALWRYVLVPVVLYGLVVPLVWIYRQLLTPLGHGIAWLVEHLLLAPARWIHRRLLTPAGHGIATVLGWLGRALFVWPWVALWRYVLVPVVMYGLVVPLVWIYRQLLTPLGHGIAWLVSTVCRGVWTAVAWLVVTLLVTPVAWLYRHVLAPVGREIADAIGVAWRIAGHLSRAVGRAVKWLARNLVARPVRWFYQYVCTPLGHAVRDGVWRPVKKTAVEAGRAARAALRSAGEMMRQARRDAWRALVGASPASKPVEPVVRQARTLGSTTTVPGVAADPEISLHQQG